MDPLSLNETFLETVVWIGIAAFILALCVLALTLYLRARGVRADERDERILDDWRRFLEKSMRRKPVDDLPLPAERHQRMLVLRLWLHAYSVASEAERSRLRALAEQTALDQVALAEVDHETLEERAAAVHALGCMVRSREEKPAWDTLIRLSRSTAPHIALLAIQALLRIDPSSAAPLVAEPLASLREARAEEVSRLYATLGPQAYAALLTAARQGGDGAQRPVAPEGGDGARQPDAPVPDLVAAGELPEWRLLATMKN